jgi:MFS transporter, ACS family, allantoate permease
MIEALLDPKTWLFAFFSCMDNIPNSLTNQRSIIVTEMGFTPLQTTLLGCVDGVVEIVTIWTGVNLAARLKDSRAYVAVLYMVPNVMGVFLIEFLPWSNKWGLMASLWVTGVGTTGFGAFCLPRSHVLFRMVD